MKVPILMPTGRDAELVGKLLDGEGLQITICKSMQELLDEIVGDCGPFIIADEGLFHHADRLIEVLEKQPGWSNVPGIILTNQSGRKGGLDRLAARREIVFAQRPIKKELLKEIVGAALDARRRQYQVKDLLENLVQNNEKLRSHSELLQRYALEVTRAENKERKRIAQILHDDLQQMLATAKLYTEMLMEKMDGDLRKEATPIYQLLSDAISSSRSLSHELSPAFAIGGNLQAAVEKLCHKSGRNFGFRVRTAIEIDNGNIDEDLGIFIYRGIQEFLFNCAKHANAENVSIEMIGRDDIFKITIKDDGVGFDADRLNIRGGDEGGFGLFSIKERVTALFGSLAVQSAPGKGSCFILELPCASISKEREPEHDIRT